MREVIALADEWINLTDSQIMDINNSKYLSLSMLQKEKVLTHLRLVGFQLLMPYYCTNYWVLVTCEIFAIGGSLGRERSKQGR